MKKITLLFIIFPFLVITQTQIGNDIDGLNNFDTFGKSISLSDDGLTVAVASYESNSLFSNGRVRVFRNFNNNWIQLGQDISGDFYNNNFDDNVSLSSNGNTLVIGSPRTNFLEGLVTVYELINNIWTQKGQSLLGDLNEESEFGNTVALSSNGNILVVSAPKYDDPALGSEIGRVRVFEFLNNTWTQIGQDILGSSQFNNLGYRLSISSNGNIIALATSENNGFNSGFVSVYENINNFWTQIGSNLVGNGIDDDFGRSVSLSANGSVLAVGAPDNVVGGANKGYVRVFVNNANQWIQVGQDIEGTNVDDFTGWDVSLSSDGTIIAVGEVFYSQDVFNPETGSTRIFKNISNSWVQVGNRIVGESNFDRSGSSVSLSSSGDIVAISAILNDSDSGNNNGHVRVYDLSTVLSLESFDQDVFYYYPNPIREVLNINVNQNLNLEKINLYNSLGQFVYSFKTTTVNTSNLKSGLYFIEVKTDRGTSTKKIIIE